MFKLFVIIFMILMGLYYVDIIGKLIKEDKREGPANYSGCKAIIPFAYWIAPFREKKKVKKNRLNVKSKSKTNENK